MNINIDTLKRETEILGNSIYYGLSNDRMVKEFSVLLSFNSILSKKANLYYNPNIILEKYPNLRNQMVKYTEKSLTEFYTKIINEDKLFKEIFKNSSKQIIDSDIQMVSFYNNPRGYSYKDAKEIIYSFFSEYGNKPYKIVKNFFDDERIQMSYEIDEGPNIGFYVGSTYLQKGYICLMYDKFDSTSLAYLAHELGHAIDKEYFYNPQQKKMKIYDNPYNEIPSTFFELGIIKYMLDNKIDEKGALSLKIFNYEQMFYRMVLAYTMLDSYTLDETQNEENFRSLFLYGLGHITSIAMNDVAHQNKKEYMKYFNNFICSRNEMEFENLIDAANIDEYDFVNGLYLKKDLDDTIKLMKKNYNIKE